MNIPKDDPCFGCGGACCTCFLLFSSEGRVSVEELLNKSRSSAYDGDRFIKWLRDDITLITKDEIINLNIIRPENIEEIFETPHVYRCKLLVNGECSDHDNRPDICKKFPNQSGAGEPYVNGCKLCEEMFFDGDDIM